MATGTATPRLMDPEWPDLDFGLKRFGGSFSKWISNNSERRVVLSEFNVHTTIILP